MKAFLKQKSDIVLFFLFVCIGFIMIVLHDNGNHNEKFMEWNPASFTEGWHYAFEDGKNGITSLPADLPANHSAKLTLTNTLPKLKNYSSLFFRARHVLLRVYVDGQLRVDTLSTIPKELRWGKLNGIYYQEIPISPEDSGKEIIIESYCNTRYLKSPGTIYLGDRGSLFLNLFRARWKTFLCCVLLALLGILLFGLWTMETFVLHQSSKEVLYLALFCVAVALWLFTESDFGQFFVKDTGKLTFLAYEVLMLLPVPIALFFVYYSERDFSKRASNIVATIPLVVFLMNNTLHSLHIVHLAETLIITQTMLAVETLSIAAIQITGLWYKYKKKEEYSSNVWIIPLFGIAILVPMATMEVIKYAFFSTKYPNDGILISLGVLFYMFALAFDSVVRMNSRAEKFKQSSEIKSQFLANMSHEIRTPLNAILGFNEIILRTSKEQKVLEYSANIHEAGSTLKTIINSILDISKIESGKLEIHPIEYSTAQMLDHIVSMFESLAAKKGLQLNATIDEHLPEVLIGDEAHITQVLTNLLSNAVKYTEKGTVTFTVKVLECLDSCTKCRLYFSVKDTGIGIHKADMDRLFEKFERLDMKRNYNTEGTGLGMSIVVKLLRAMDSEIRVESVYGQGSLFYFELEQQVQTPDAIGAFLERRKTLLQENRRDTDFIAPNAKILIVDDLKMNLDTVCVLLEQIKVHADTAMSGAEAIAKIRNIHYDIILMDHMMPDMDGIETTTQIRNLSIKTNDPYYGNLPILALTANAIVGMREIFLKAGMQDFISKPIEVNTLYSTIRRWLPLNKIIMTQKSANKAEEQIIWAKVPVCMDMETACQFCPSKELLLRNVKTFINTCKSTCDKLSYYRQEKDVENYTVIVHGLKSSSKIIGLNELSEQAKEQEMNCQSGKPELAWEHTDELIGFYQNAVEDMKTFLTENSLVQEPKEEDTSLSLEEYEKLYNRIIDAAMAYDLGEFMKLEEEFEHIRVPKEKQEEFERIKELVINASFGELIAYVENRGNI